MYSEQGNDHLCTMSVSRWDFVVYLTGRFQGAILISLISI